MTCAQSATVDRHFATRLAPDVEAALRAHLDGCAPCRERYRRQLLLASLRPRGTPPKARLARALGVAPPRRSWVVPTLAPALAAAAVLLALGVSHGPRGPQPTARGATVSAVPELAIIALAKDAPPSRIAGPIPADTELAFSYRNPTGRAFLLVYGRDARGGVHWYYPAWTDASTDPVAIPIEKATDRSRPLPDAISHPLPPGPLEVRAIFSDRAWHVREIEQLIAAAGTADLPLAEADQLHFSLEVTP